MFEEEAEMLTKKAIVDKTITFKNEERVPIWVDGPSIGPSDVLTYDLSLPASNAVSGAFSPPQKSGATAIGSQVSG